ncbi:MAG: hypothetical protein WBO73_13045 [Gammaproteobacteria bacterium]|jgi:hypothetical protein
MLSRFFILLALLTFFMSLTANELKNFNLGVGYYSLQLYDEAETYDSDRFNGLSLSASYMFTNRIALRGNYYSLSQSDFAYSDVDGWEVLALFGNGLATQGGKWYVGGGYFNEQWEGTPGSDTFNGLQLGGGFGYNWETIALEMQLSLRDTGDYDDTLGTQTTDIDTAGVLAVILSARF